MYGSLLGAIVYQDINPREVDNDFVIPHNFSHYVRKFHLDKKFHEHNLTLFRDNIYRVCRTRRYDEKTYNDAPWVSKYIPYSDLYPTQFKPYREPTFGNMSETTWSTRKIRIRNREIMAPSTQFTTELLLRKYGPHFANKNNLIRDPMNLWKVKAHQEYRRQSKDFRRVVFSRPNFHPRPSATPPSLTELMIVSICLALVLAFTKIRPNRCQAPSSDCTLENHLH